MTTPSHPSPAEVCRQREWKAATSDTPGTKVNAHGVNLEITYIGINSIVAAHVGARSTAEFFYGHEADITAWIKVEPPPVVRIKDIGGCGFAACVDGTEVINVYVSPFAARVMSEPRAFELARITAEAGKAAIEGDMPGDAKAEPGVCEGPFAIVSDPMGSDVTCDEKQVIAVLSLPYGREKIGHTRTLEACRDIAEFAANYLNRLHAKASNSQPDPL